MYIPPICTSHMDPLYVPVHPAGMYIPYVMYQWTPYMCIPPLCRSPRHCIYIYIYIYIDWDCHGNTLMASVALTLAMCRSEFCALRRRAILVGWVCTFWRAHSWRLLLSPGQYLIYGHRWGTIKRWHKIRQFGWAVQQDGGDGSEEVMVHAEQFDCQNCDRGVKRDGLVVGDQIRFIVLPPRQGKLHGRAGDINELIRSGQPRCGSRSPRRAPSPTVNIVGTSVSVRSFRPRQDRPCGAPPVVKAKDEQDDDMWSWSRWADATGARFGALWMRRRHQGRTTWRLV